MRSSNLFLLTAIAVAACGGPTAKAPERADLSGEAIEWTPGSQPEPVAGECWESDISPAIIETVTEQKIVNPEVRDETGTVTTPATYSTTTRQEMVQDRTEIWFRAPCPEVQTPEFFATLQRALKARGYYVLPLTGLRDPATAEALRRFQAERGLDSPLLSLGAAKELGLISTDFEDL